MNVKFETFKDIFEYKIVTFINKLDSNIENEFNKLGNDGWELVNIRDGLCYTLPNEHKIYTVWKRKSKK